MLQLMGILNLTPDSFSGDGLSADGALIRLNQLVMEGADIIDIGAESTRPGATSLTDDEEWLRLAPLLLQLPRQRPYRISVDSYHPSTMARALEAGVDIANDVRGLRDDAMCAVLAAYPCDVVVMHSLTVPADPAVTWPEGADPVALLLAWKADMTARAERAGIDAARLIYDPGLGFGKTAEQSLQLVQRAAELVSSGGRWLFGHSRKSFLKLLTDAPAAERDGVTIVLSASLANAGVQLLRVHAVEPHRRMREALCM